MSLHGIQKQKIMLPTLQHLYPDYVDETFEVDTEIIKPGQLIGEQSEVVQCSPVLVESLSAARSTSPPPPASSALPALPIHLHTNHPEKAIDSENGHDSSSSNAAPPSLKPLHAAFRCRLLGGDDYDPSTKDEARDTPLH